MLIYFCDTCKNRIPAAEIEAKTAVFVEENRALCAKCAVARKSSKSSRPVIRVGTHATESSKTLGAVGTAIKGEGGQTSGEAAAPAPAGRTLPANLKHAILVCCAGLILFVIGLFVSLRGGGSEDSGEDTAANAQALNSKSQGNRKDEKVKGRARGPLPPLPSAAAAQTKLENPSSKKAAASEPPKTVPAVAPEPVAAKIIPIVVAAAPDETIWVEDALPPGASGDGTLKADSWKWAVQPEPVFSGTHSHTMGTADGQPKPPGLQRHSFHGANPPLQVSLADVLFTYVYLDPNDPPKEIMLEWQFRDSWEHRAYWGQDEIQLGTNFSPSRMQAGSLPKTGAWVRLEVRASEIGVEAEHEPVTGWSFAQFGGLAYWDRSGVVVKPAPAAVAAVSPPPPPPPQPAPPETPPKTPTVAHPNPAPAPAPSGTVGKLLWKDLKGGEEPKEKKGDKDSRAAWAKPTQKNVMYGTVELAAKGKGFGAAELVTTTYLHGKQPCQIVLSINDKEVYKGRDAATKKGQWSEQRYPIPAGLLREGKNEIRIENQEPAGDLNKEPWYMIHSVEVVLAPEFPPVVSEAQRALIRACEHVEQITKKELDPPAKIEQALRLAKGATGPEAALLAGVLEKAQALYHEALANLAKTPPAEDVRIERLKQTVHVVRVAGSKAYIKSQGMEMNVDAAWLPQSVFLKALALDESKAAGLAGKAAFCFALGNEEPAQALLKRFKKEELPAWAAFFDQRKALLALAKFESAVNNVDALLKSAKPADALPALEALKKEYPDLLEANKERINYLAAAAQAKQ